LKIGLYTLSLFFILLAFVISAPFLSVYADIIIEPDNDFFSRNKAECRYLGRNFVVDGPDGSALVKPEPGKGKETASVKNGETIYLEYSCLYKGEFWGYAPSYPGRPPGAREAGGWLKIDGQLLALYDYIAFEEENADNLIDSRGDLSEIKASGAAIAWPWPGAGFSSWTIDNLDEDSLFVLHVYEDAQGREWGFAPYLYGSRNVWFCLSDPLNGDIPAFNPAPAPAAWASETAHADIGKIRDPAYMIAIIFIALLIIGTIVILKIFWKPATKR
jgi:hypothetical protein